MGDCPCPRPQALPFGLIRRRHRRMEGREYLLCPWPAPHSPSNIPCAFLSLNLCADRSPHTESPPTRLYASRSFPSVRRCGPHTLTEPSRPAQDGQPPFIRTLCLPLTLPFASVVSVTSRLSGLPSPPQRTETGLVLFLPCRVLLCMGGAPWSPEMPDLCGEHAAPGRGFLLLGKS